jgi:glutamate 5-kinase
MLTKCSIARKVADEGIRVIIANGLCDNILLQLVEEPENVAHTEFIPNESPASGVKKWIAHSGSFAKGEVRVNANAAKALRGQQAVSLLMVGVTAVEGNFQEGDIVTIADQDGQPIGVGRSDYSSEQAQSLIGVRDVKPIVHYNYLYVEPS